MINDKIQKAIRHSAVRSNGDDLHAVLQIALHEAGIAVSLTTLERMVAECLANHPTFSGDRRYPIKHPTLDAATAYCDAMENYDFWDGSEYGRNRIAALTYIQEVAHRFSIKLSVLTYTPDLIKKGALTCQ